MAILNTYQLLYPGYGQPTVYGVQNTISLSAGPQTNSFTTANTSGLAQGMTKGLVRVKVYNGGGANTTVAFTVAATDGTNTYVIANVPATTIANAANSGCDFYIDFGVDISATQFNIITTVAGTTTTATMDIELVAGP